jgi:hypothetical protein
VIRRLALLFVLTLTAGCGTGAAVVQAPQPQVVLLRPSAPGPALRQGLVVDQDRSTLLVSLDGHPYARLDHAHSWWATIDTARNAAFNAAFKALGQAIPMETLVEGPGGRWYLWDSAAARLHPLAEPRLLLAGGIVASAKTHGTDDTTAYEVYISVRRHGRLLMPPARHLHFISHDLIATDTRAVDLETGTHWSFSRNCAPAGSSGVELFLACTPASLNGPTHVIALAAKRKRTLGLLPNGLFVYEAMLSPDGNYISANLSPGCGPSYSFLVPTHGGRTRPLAGGAHWSQKTPPSKTLGWTQNNRLVVFIARSGSCESGSRSGIYLVNPRTLAGRFVYPSASAMWNPSFR